MRTDVLCNSWGQRLLALLLVFAVVALTRSSFASTSYPNRLKSRWAVSGKLPGGGQDGCLLCHSKEAGGTGTAIKAFAQILRTKYGLVGADIDSLDYALDQSRSRATDSDRDTFSDYDELSSFATDPNDAESHPIVDAGGGGEAGAPSATGGTAGTAGASATGGVVGNVEEPEPAPQCAPSGPTLPIAEYGCSLAGAPARSSRGATAMLVLSCVAALRAKRRRRARRDVEPLL